MSRRYIASPTTDCPVVIATLEYCAVRCEPLGIAPEIAELSAYKEARARKVAALKSSRPVGAFQHVSRRYNVSR